MPNQKHSAARIGALAAFGLWVLLPFGAAHAQGKIPDGAQAFLKWCAEKGFTTKDSAGETCPSTIALDVMTVLLLSTDDECEALEKRVGQKNVAGFERAYAKPIYDWMRANPQKTRGKRHEAVIAALAALYKCKD